MKEIHLVVSWLKTAISVELPKMNWPHIWGYLKPLFQNGRQE